MMKIWLIVATMTAPEIISGNITQTLTAFDHFVNLYETNAWLTNSTKEDVKNFFKAALFVEKTVENFQKKSCLDRFLKTLNSWWMLKSRTKVYDVEFFTLACDHMLAKLFKTKLASESAIGVALSMYTTCFTKQRLANMLKDLCTETVAFKILLNNATSNLQGEIECKLLLNNWSNEIECGRATEVTDVINDMLSNYKVCESLFLLISMLALKEITEAEKQVQKFILQRLEPKFSDRSILSNSFWVTLVKNIDKNKIAAASEFQEFLDGLIDFIIYIGSTMTPEIVDYKRLWIPNSNYPEITYDDLLAVLQHLSHGYIIKKLSELKSKIWPEILAEL